MQLMRTPARRILLRANMLAGDRFCESLFVFIAAFSMLASNIICVAECWEDKLTRKIGCRSGSGTCFALRIV